MDRMEAFEQSDLDGSTVHVNGTATTTATQVLSGSNTKDIAEVLVDCILDQGKNNRLLVSFDGDSTPPFKTLVPGGHVAWSLKGGIKDIWVKTDSGTADFEMLINKES